MLSIINTDSTDLPLRSGIATLVYVDPPRSNSINIHGGIIHDFEKFTHLWFFHATRIMAPDSYLLITTNHLTRYMIEKEIHYSLPEGIKYVQELIWWYSFGLYSTRHFVNTHETILVLKKGNPKYNWTSIAIRSARQDAGDPRADQRGRNPDGFLIPTTVCKINRRPGNSLDRYFMESELTGKRSCQPIDLVEVFIKAYTTNSTDLIVDMFGGSGSMIKAAQKLGRSCISIDKCYQYCKEEYERLFNNWKRIQGV